MSSRAKAFEQLALCCQNNCDKSPVGRYIMELERKNEQLTKEIEKLKQAAKN